MNKILNILLGIIFFLHQILEGNSKEFYQLSINERGTPFNETIEIDDVEKTVVYKVPSHNEIKKTDVLVDYKNGRFVTKIPEKQACYIKAFSKADEQSIGQTRQNFKLIQRIKTRSGNASVPVETVTTIMKLIREIPREELSPKVLDFCGKNSAYQVEEEIMPRKKGKSVIKRSSGQVTRNYSMPILPSQAMQGMKKILPNGYLTCKSVEDHNTALFSCLLRKKTPMVGCGIYPVTCRTGLAYVIVLRNISRLITHQIAIRYQAFCEVKTPEKGKESPAKNLRDTDYPINYNWVNIKCVEEHKFTVAWCCDVIPCKK